MPAATRSRKKPKKAPDFYILIDKTPRNTTDRSINAAVTVKGQDRPKKRVFSNNSSALSSAVKPKARVKRFAAQSSVLDVEVEEVKQPANIGEPDGSIQRLLSSAGPPASFITPPRSHPPPQPPKRPDHHSHDPKTTLPPQFINDGTPSPEPGKRHSQRVLARASSLLPPSSPIYFSSSPLRQTFNHSGESSLILLSAHRPGSPSQFRTPTRKDKKRKRTPLSSQLQSEGEINNDDLFVHGVVDDLDEREDSVGWVNAGSDKENHGGLQEIPGSDDILDNKEHLPMPITSERGILQPREVSHSPARSSESDPFGFLATERLLKARRSEKMLNLSEAGPSNAHRGPRFPLGELTAAKVASASTTPPPAPLAASPSQFQPIPTSLHRRYYSDSDIEDLYAPASPPHTPRERLPQAHATHPQPESTPIAAANPLTPRNGDSARAFTMRRRRQKELHGVSEHGSEIQGSSAPSSPSPIKHVHQRLPDPESQLEYDDPESDKGGASRPQKRAKIRGKGKGKENAVGKSLTVEDPLEAARRVLENAPRRQPERRAATTGKKKTTSTSIEESGDKRRERRQSARGRGAPRSVDKRVTRSKKSSGMSRLRKKKGDESTPEELRERRNQERLKRIEYFKQLDGYKLQKENVYVI